MHPKKHPQKISRRDLLKASAALSASVVVSGCGSGSTAAPEQTSQLSGQTSRPNVLFILVDQMRFPKFFPSGINSADDFIKTYMPNTYTLWKRGVKFSNHYIAATE